MKYFARIGMNRATNSAVLTLVRSADSAPLLVDGEPVEVECNYEFVDKCLSLPYLDGLERRIKAIEEDQERLARIEVRDALEYERLRAKFAARGVATEETEKPDGFVASDVVDALEQDGLRSAAFTYDARGGRVVVVDMGPHIGTRRIPIDGTETTVELAEKIRSVLPKEWKVST